MPAVWIICSGILLLYFSLIIFYRCGWKRLIRQEFREGKHPHLSVVIPVRNEEKGIGLLLNDLAVQDYPGQYEIIIIDDHSSDETGKIIESFNKTASVKFLSLGPSEAGKKAALKKGLQAAGNSIILSTDGDCRVSPGWMSEMAAGFSDAEVRMIAGTVTFYPCKGIFQKLQSLEFFSHIAVAAGSAGLNDPILCSAANLAYYRDDYLDFIKSHSSLSESGDDIFFLLWLKKHRKRSIRFNSSQRAAVNTFPAVNPGSFFRQRMRWTSKSRYYRDLHILCSALVVFGLNALLFLLLLVCLLIPLAGISVPGGLVWLFAGLLFGKSMADLVLMFPVLRHYEATRLLGYFGIMELIYFMYVSFVGIAGQLLAFSWKGRKINA